MMISHQKHEKPEAPLKMQRDLIFHLLISEYLCYR